ncbi:flagellar protein FlaG [Shewanella sp. UCD-KL21]|uniref:flagellar protein FlaG n=1 Tax=Shewanella sp. UCD-KL21 TaxID=1917164 RepID=UPI0009707BCF|nr:flagellar protein FlaG [Shewanella sp. UCD-KL21]
MDVNITNVANAAVRKDSLANLTEKNAAQASTALADDGIQKAGDVARTTAKVNETAKTDAEQLQHAVDDINQQLSLMQKGLAFNIDEESGLQVVKVIDVKTGDLIRQIPNEEALEMASKLTDIASVFMETAV